MTVLGNVDEISRRRVVGWAYDPAMPNDSVSVAVHVNGHEVGRCTAASPREGLKEHLGGDATGLYGFEFEFEPPLSVFQEYTVRMSAVGTEEPLPNGVRILPAPARASAPLLPVIITSTGRSGTTLLMSEFAASRDIVVAGAYPFEIKLVGYYAAAFRTLTAPADRTNSTDPETMFSPQNRFHIGHNPYNSLELHRAAGLKNTFGEFFEKLAPQKLSALFRQLIDEYYGAASAEQNKPAARFFAEKGDIEETARLGARQFFGGLRELVVVRDPRDLLCSAMRFWKLEAADALEMLKTTLPLLEEIHSEAAPDSLFIRYEDLIAAPAATRGEIYRFLGLDPDAMPLPNTDPKLFARHGTSARPADSIQRWERELDSELIQACNASFASYIERFGYASGSGGKASIGSKPKRSDERSSDLRVIVGRDRVAALLQDDDHLHRVLEIGFGTAGNSAQYLGSGWAAGEGGFTWTSGLESRLEFPAPRKPGDYRLRLFLRPFLRQPHLRQQRLTIAVNGTALGSTSIDADIVAVECAIPWAVFERHSNAALCLLLPDAARASEFRGTPDDRMLAFRFERIELLLAAPSQHNEQEPPAASDRSNDPRALMANFQNIGENCEFGFVQRRCGIDPVELLRFSSSPIPRLIGALRSGFAGLGDPSRLSVELSENGREYMVHDQVYGFVHHAWVLAGEMSPEEIHRREAARLPVLVRDLLDDLRKAEKILVYHGLERLDPGAVLGLLENLRSYGPNTLLWVEPADPEHPPGRVEWAAPHLLKAYIDRFAPIDDPNDMSFEIWEKICRAAYRLWQEARAGEAIETRDPDVGAGEDIGTGLRIAAEGPDAARHAAASTWAAEIHPAVDVAFGKDGNCAAYLGNGWSAGEAGYTWNAGRESRLSLPRPAAPGPYRLRLLVRPFLWQERLASQRLILQANDVRIGGVAVAQEPALIECDLPWPVLENSEEMRLVFFFPDAARPSEVKGGSDDRLLAFRFERIALTRVAEAEAGSGETYPTAEQVKMASASLISASPEPAPREVNSTMHDVAMVELPVSELMMRFESLGENCEFGLVQRRCGAEPLSLLRFASAPLAKLLAGLESRFEGLSEPENLDVQISSNGREYMVLDRKFQLLYHAWVLTEEMSADAVRQQEARRLPLLVRKLIEDLQRAEKVFVFHGMEALSEAEAIGLLRRLRSYGPNTLLWVELADADHPPGWIEWAGEGLLKAYIDRFAPGENAHDFSLDCWIAICRAAYRLRQAGMDKDPAAPLRASAAAQ